MRSIGTDMNHQFDHVILDVARFSISQLVTREELRISPVIFLGIESVGNSSGVVVDTFLLCKDLQCGGSDTIPSELVRISVTLKEEAESSMDSRIDRSRLALSVQIIMFLS